MTKEIIIRNRVIFITSKSDPKSAYKVDESKQCLQNKFYLSPPSECVEHHLLVEISTKDSCLSESQFFFCLFFWSLRLTALRLDPDSGVRPPLETTRREEKVLPYFVFKISPKSLKSQEIYICHNLRFTTKILEPENQ